MTRIPPRFVKVSETLQLSGCGRYAVEKQLMGMGYQFVAYYFDGVGWGPAFDKPADSMAEVRDQIEYHRFHRPLERKGA